MSDKTCVLCEWSGEVGHEAHARLIHPEADLIVVEQMGQRFIVDRPNKRLDDLTEPVPVDMTGVPRREPAGSEPGQGAVTGSVRVAPLCGFVMATCWNEPAHRGDHWNPAIALAAQPSAEPGLHPDDADAKRRPIQTVGGVRVGAAALTPDRPTPRVGCFPQAHRYDRIGVTDRLRCRRCGFEKPG